MTETHRGSGTIHCSMRTLSFICQYMYTQMTIKQYCYSYNNLGNCGICSEMYCDSSQNKTHFAPNLWPHYLHLPIYVLYI